MKTSTSIFKLLKSSWGIWIQITGESTLIKNEANQFQINLEKSNFSEKEIAYIKGGFKWVSERIEKSTVQKRLIKIKKIDLVLTDYQEEGLFYGTAFWLSEHFQCEMPEFDFKFNKIENKYKFPDLE